MQAVRGNVEDASKLGSRAGVLAIALGASLVGFSASARDQGQWDDSSALRGWYEALMQPDNPTQSCCGPADSYFCDDYRMERGKALCTISDDREDAPRRRPHIPIGTVIEIPPHKLKWDRGNPTGHGVVFVSPGGYVFCYVQPGGV